MNLQGYIRLTALLLIIHPLILQAEDEINVNVLNPPPGEKPVRIQTMFFLSDINNIDDLNETFEIKGLMELRWMDKRQAFDPDVEGMDFKLFQGTFQFLEVYTGWWPNLIAANGIGSIPFQGVSLRIEPDGEMIFLQEISAILKSPMDLRKFPFDRQNLTAIFEPLGFYASEVVLLADEKSTDLPGRFLRVSGWELISLSSEMKTDVDEETQRDYSQLILNLEMKRKPAFTIWFIMFPLSLIILLSTSVYWMDAESLGNRMDISFIGLLTIVAYQALVESGMPHID